ncbi:3-hydroxyisobutyrate dehydrogenase [Aureococcus anophagefferens]|nr:3-hydroxyisobutyrate dehydrogenase [Aureococcus anophagefferens]
MALRKIGFVGLGNMGYGMARNVARTALVSAFDGDVAIGPKLAAEVGQVEAAADVAGAARGADAVVTSLPSNDAVRAVYLGPGGVLEALAAGSACVDTSTVDPAVSREVAAAAAAKNITFLDAPVSGGVPAADAGTLTFMVGATRGRRRRAAPGIDGRA